MRFYDSNILVYAALSQDDEKRNVALELIRRARAGESVAISVQTLRETANVLFKESGYSARQIASVLSGYAQMPVVRDDEEMLLDAIAVKERYGLQFYDACIVAAAKKAGCSEIYSEDMGDGQEYDGVAVVNPFKAKPRARRR